MPARVTSENWIRVRESLFSDPRVDRIATLIGQGSTGDLLQGALPVTSKSALRVMLRNITVAGLLQVWFAANRHTHAGTFTHCSRYYLDDLAGIDGFTAAMEAVGWANWNPDDSITLPDFEVWNDPRKGDKRSANARRVLKSRALKKLDTLPHWDTPEAITLLEKLASIGHTFSPTTLSRHTPDTPSNALQHALQGVTRNAEREKEGEREKEPSLKQTHTHRASADEAGEETGEGAGEEDAFGIPPRDWPKTAEAARDMAAQIGVDPDIIEAIWSEHESTGNFSIQLDATSGKRVRMLKARQYFNSRGKRAASRRQQAPTGPRRSTGGTSSSDHAQRAAFAQREQARETVAQLRRASYTTDQARTEAKARIEALEVQIREHNKTLKDLTAPEGQAA